VSVQLVEVFSTPSQQYVGPLSAGLHSMARGDVCIGALHAFGARCTHPPLASGVLNALTTSPRCGATQPNIRTIEVSTALPDERPCLDYSYGENKKEGEQILRT
jgi:hypothetical protein